jgi:hypothetical protein
MVCAWPQDFHGQKDSLELGLDFADMAMSIFKFFFEELKLDLIEGVVQR